MGNVTFNSTTTTISKSSFFAAILFLFSVPVLAQDSEIHPGLDGTALVAELQSDYYPSSPKSYTSARDEMYQDLDVQNGEIVCVYTGLTVNADGTRTPGGQFNTEHVWPQSLFNQNSPMRGDIHHLYPTWETANSVRSNYPFAEIPDQQTDKWLYNGQQTSGIPTSNIDLYSESTNSAFEPREDFKGNIARSVFYFWTVYQNNSSITSNSSNESFFEEMREVLYEWHLLDPVDEAEVERSLGVENVQGNRNPFVHDTSLVRRAYMEDYTGPGPGDGDDDDDNGNGNGGDDNNDDDIAGAITETFDGITSIDDGSPTSSYTLREFTGQAGGTWTATDARIDQTINGPAILIRNGSLTSPEFSGGIKKLTLTTQRIFTGGAEDLSVLVNGDEVGTIAYSDNAQTHSIDDIDIEGSVVIEIKSTNEDRIALDDFILIPIPVEDPVISMTPGSAVDFTYTEGNGPSVEESLIFSGEFLAGDVKVFAPSNFDLSATSGESFSAIDTLVLPQVDGSVADTTFYVRLSAGLPSGNHTGIFKLSSPGTDTLEIGLTGTVEEGTGVNIADDPFEKPKQFALGQNYPNPFNPATEISYQIAEHSKMHLAVYNVMGQHVATLVDESKSPGTYQVSWDAGSMSSGVYYYRLQSAGQILTRKMTLIK
ncbi:MAG: endonuclease [Balneolaceae bacterium]